MTRAVFLVSVLAAALAATACAVEHDGSGVSPTPTAGPTSYIGTWLSTVGPTGPNACSNFEWRVTNQTATMISGLFFARCPGGLAVSGSAWGELKGAGAAIPVSATAGGTGPGVLTCDVSLNGPAVVDNDTIRIPYSGTTCLGPVSGTEVLQRR